MQKKLPVVPGIPKSWLEKPADKPAAPTVSLSSHECPAEFTPPARGGVLHPPPGSLAPGAAGADEGDFDSALRSLGTTLTEADEAEVDKILAEQLSGSDLVQNPGGGEDRAATAGDELQGRARLLKEASGQKETM